MRKLTYSAAVSLDGFIAGPDEAIDWIRWSKETEAMMADAWKKVDAILMGRRTYEFAARSGGGPGGAKMRTYVFSTTMETAPKGAELVRKDAAGFVAALKQQEGGDIWLMGGGGLAATLIEAGLVEEIGLSVHPVLLGGGTATFGAMARRTELELAEARSLDNGCVSVRYRPARAPSDLRRRATNARQQAKA